MAVAAMQLALDVAGYAHAGCCSASVGLGSGERGTFVTVAIGKIRDQGGEGHDGGKLEESAAVIL